MPALLLRLGLLLMGLSPFSGLFAQFSWTPLDSGLWYAEYQPQDAPGIGDGIINLLRIDPAQYCFELMSAKQAGEGPLTAEAWAQQGGLIAAVNAGMYQADYATNLGFMQHYDFVNNPRLNQDNCIAAFNPKKEGVPPFQLIDRSCQDWETLRQQYHSFSQSIRMVDCHRRNRWSVQPKKWSMVVLGEDAEGQALFIFTRSPWRVHDFIDQLLALPIGLQKAMYLEGGPEASLFLQHPQKTVRRFGSYETGFFESDANEGFWPVPNVIGVKRIK